jgi:hypothetical protein
MKTSIENIPLLFINEKYKRKFSFIISKENKQKIHYQFDFCQKNLKGDKIKKYPPPLLFFFLNLISI